MITGETGRSPKYTQVGMSVLVEFSPPPWQWFYPNIQSFSITPFCPSTLRLCCSATSTSTSKKLNKCKNKWERLQKLRPLFQRTSFLQPYVFPPIYPLTCTSTIHCPNNMSNFNHTRHYDKRLKKKKTSQAVKPASEPSSFPNKTLQKFSPSNLHQNIVHFFFRFFFSTPQTSLTTLQRHISINIFR